jgi:hypothetical protein
VLEREAPGLSEAMRLVNPLGRLSRGRAGTVGQCLILNCPGSPRGALECLEAVLDVVAHALELLSGDAAPHPPETGGQYRDLVVVTDEGPGVGGLAVHPDATDLEHRSKRRSVAANGLVEHDLE